jgi:hypothetical protein
MKLCPRCGSRLWPPDGDEEPRCVTCGWRDWGIAPDIPLEPLYEGAHGRELDGRFRAAKRKHTGQE